MHVATPLFCSGVAEVYMCVGSFSVAVTVAMQTVKVNILYALLYSGEEDPEKEETGEHTQLETGVGSRKVARYADLGGQVINQANA